MPRPLAPLLRATLALVPGDFPARRDLAFALEVLEAQAVRTPPEASASLWESFLTVLARALPPADAANGPAWALTILRVVRNEEDAQRYLTPKDLILLTETPCP
jgi:hypothetical protein